VIPIVRSRWSRIIAGVAILAMVAAACHATPGDFTADGKADQIYAAWDTHGATGSFFRVGDTTPFYTGPAGGIPVPADYNGDLKWEPAILYGKTWVSSAVTAPMVYDPAGMPAGPAALPAGFGVAPILLLPVPGDYDGTGKAVPAYYDQVDATWWIMGHDTATQFGIPPVAGGNSGYDLPVPNDYDGDGKTDIAIYRPIDGSFHYLSSETGHEVVSTPTAPAGYPAFFPVPATYDGVASTQPAVTDWAGENWYVAGHAGTFATFPNASWAKDTYIPAPAAYDGGGKAEPALFDGDTNSFWFDGQPQPPQQPRSPQPDAPAVIPYALLANYVRLTFYANCRLHPSSSCAGVT
jgi:hypothetical protein